MMGKLVLSGLLVAMLSACSTPGYQCKLTDKSGACASLSDAYSAAIHAKSEQNSETVFSAGPAHASVKQPRPVIGSLQPYPQAAERGNPVYEQADVHRVWTSPWTDANGLLHGGEYLYFTTPGHWRYGELTAPGQASGIFTPLKPGAYGFTAVDDAKLKAAAEAKKQKIADEARAGNPGAAATQSGITQPFFGGK
ncbi:MAG: TraV family lipoprotein [Candidatus Nanopelagicales bacterium]